MKQTSKRYNFDFKNEKPLPPSSRDKYNWVSLPENQTPRFYHSKTQNNGKKNRLNLVQKVKKVKKVKQMSMNNFINVKRRGNVDTSIKLKVDFGRVNFRTRSMSSIRTRSKLDVIDYRS